MASVVGICNSALIKIGANRITSLTDGSTNANACNEQYEKLRDDLLRSHTWNFAAARAKLPRLTAAPTFGFDHAYQLPADWLRTKSVHDSEAGAGTVRYRREGRKILSDATDIFIRYVHRVTDPNEMTADFHEALAFLMARELAIPLANSGTLHDRMDHQFAKVRLRARSTDSLDDYPENMPDGSWVTER